MLAARFAETATVADFLAATATVADFLAATATAADLLTGFFAAALTAADLLAGFRWATVVVADLPAVFVAADALAAGPGITALGDLPETAFAATVFPAAARAAATGLPVAVFAATDFAARLVVAAAAFAAARPVAAFAGTSFFPAPFAVADDDAVRVIGALTVDEAEPVRAAATRLAALPPAAGAFTEPADFAAPEDAGTRGLTTADRLPDVAVTACFPADARTAAVLGDFGATLPDRASGIARAAPADRAAGAVRAEALEAALAAGAALAAFDAAGAALADRAALGAAAALPALRPAAVAATRDRPAAAAGVVRDGVPGEVLEPAAGVRARVPEGVALDFEAAPAAAGLVEAFFAAGIEAAGIEVFLLANDCGHVRAWRCAVPAGIPAPGV